MLSSNGDSSIFSAGRRSRWLAALLVFVLSFPVFLSIYAPMPVIFDSDSYYHLAVARTYLEEGFVEEFPWTRFSIMRHGFGDKEFLFHVFLMPFAAFPDTVFGGKAALAFLDSLAAALMAFIAVYAVGWAGVFVPLWFFVTASNFTIRLLSLRPEIPALMLFVLAAMAVVHRRRVLLGLVSLLFALSYTAFHALLILCFGWFLCDGWMRKKWDWKLVIYPLAGVAAGLALHPHFPHNLRVWAAQNVDLFRYKHLLDTGTEFLPSTTRSILLLNPGWLIGLLVLLRAGKNDDHQPAWERPRDIFLVAAFAFGFLFILMQRFAVFFFFFLTLALLFEFRRKNRSFERWVRLPGRGRIPLTAAFCVCLALGVPTVRQLKLAMQKSGALLPERQTEYVSFGSAVPDGARIASPWLEAEAYVYWAPQGSYLNVLDPVFMAVYRPEIYGIQKNVFFGLEPDIPLTLTERLDSDYIAFSGLTSRGKNLLKRLSHDPRLELRHGQFNWLYHVLRDANNNFMLDWTVYPDTLPSDEGFQLEAGLPYPRSASAGARRVEGYVDGRRVVSGGSCATFVHRKTIEEEGPVTYQLAPYGPASLWVDGRLVTSMGEPGYAVLDEGVLVKLSLPPGSHQIAVHTCPVGERLGFYLLEK